MYSWWNLISRNWAQICLTRLNTNYSETRKPHKIMQTTHKSRKPLDKSPRFEANRSVLSLWTYKPVKMQMLLVEYRSKPLTNLSDERWPKKVGDESITKHLFVQRLCMQRIKYFNSELYHTSNNASHYISSSLFILDIS